jgi:predicted membrane channel-forming protein YqfA (hemolysin III family)
MWMLSFIPDTWLYTAVLSILFGGMAIYVIGMACGFIPTLVLYKAPLQALGLIAIIAGVYFYGSYSTEQIWRGRVADMQVKLDQAAMESHDINEQLSIERQKKQQVIINRQIVYRDRIKEIEKRIDQACVLDPEVPRILNDAATNPFTLPATPAEENAQ